MPRALRPAEAARPEGLHAEGDAALEAVILVGPDPEADEISPFTLPAL
jgi:hypothetical protein